MNIMLIAVDLLISILFFALFAQSVSRFARVGNARLTRLNRHARAFFKAANELIDDPEITETQRKIIGSLCYALSTNERAEAVCKKVGRLIERDETEAPIKDFFGATTRVRKEMLRVAVHGLLAVSYRAKRYGPAVRADIADFMDDPVATLPIAAQVERVQAMNLPQDIDCFAAA